MHRGQSTSVFFDSIIRASQHVFDYQFFNKFEKDSISHRWRQLQAISNQLRFRRSTILEINASCSPEFWSLHSIEHNIIGYSLLDLCTVSNMWWSSMRPVFFINIEVAVDNLILHINLCSDYEKTPFGSMRLSSSKSTYDFSLV